MDPCIPIAEIYGKTLKLFQDRSRWAQGYYNFYENGERCARWNEGHSFCVLGANLFHAEGFSHRSQCCLQRVSEHLYGEVIQEVNDAPDADGAYKKVMFALQFAKELWEGREPSDEELGMPVVDLLNKRKAHG